MKIARKLAAKFRCHYLLPDRLALIQESLCRIESRLNASRSFADPREYEFKVYSQWGEDGIIDHLCQLLQSRPISRPTRCSC